MNQELYEQATYPGVNAAGSAELLRRLSAAAREQVLEALAAALVRRDAVEMADAIEAGPLAEAREAAVEPRAAVEEARQALVKEQGSVSSRLAAFWASTRRSDPDDRERPPDADSDAVQALRAELAAAEDAAQPFVQRVQYHEGQVSGLRAAPRPDPAVLEVLGLGATDGEGR
jgi:hypothetical protein